MACVRRPKQLSVSAALAPAPALGLGGGMRAGGWADRRKREFTVAASRRSGDALSPSIGSGGSVTRSSSASSDVSLSASVGDAAVLEADASPSAWMLKIPTILTLTRVAAVPALQSSVWSKIL